jgi:hypothetical protein
MQTNAERAAYYLNYFSGDQSYGGLRWNMAVPGKRAEANTSLGTYVIEIKPNGILHLTFNSGTEIRICPTKFTATNRAQGEASDHHARLLAQQGRNPSRMKPPKW